MKTTINIKIERSRPREKVFVKTFHIYDINNIKDPEVIKMNKLLAAHPEYETQYWQVRDSDWGYDIYRPETDEEYDRRLRAEKDKRTWRRIAKEFKNE